MTSLGSHFKTKPRQQTAQVAKPENCIGCTPENLEQKFLHISHVVTLQYLFLNRNAISSIVFLPSPRMRVIAGHVGAYGGASGGVLPLAGATEIIRGPNSQ